jgi:hypothetical protein
MKKSLIAFVLVFIFLSAAPALATPSLELGTATSSGSFISFPVKLASAQGSYISGIEANIVFNSQIFGFSSVSLGAAATAAGKQLAQSTPQSGVLRIVIADLVGNNSIADGLVAQVKLSLLPGVTLGSYSINVAPTATDSHGNNIAITGSPTVITLYKAGDCNKNNTVDIAEVQSSINMFLGLKAVDACVDVNDDKTVGIDEVQKTINAFLGL